MLKPRQKLDKYRIERRLAVGGFATVYKAYDTVEGVRVALKVPHKTALSPSKTQDFRKEVRLMAKLDHPNILPIKTAGFIGGLFVIVYPLGEQSLDERMRRRLSLRTALGYAEQTLEALAHAHRNKVIHCDVKPSNLLLFPSDRLRLADFGIARFAQRTVAASGSGTLGYIAPEQAMGKPSFRSDVFAAGLVIYEMLTGRLPEWPFDWPPPGYEKIRNRVHPELTRFLQRALEVDARRRFENADKMLAAFRRIKPRVLASATRRAQRRKKAAAPPANNWKRVRLREFNRAFRKPLEISATCSKCHGPISERMQFCPWCCAPQKVYKGPTRFPERCERCGRGMKRDWRFCPSCYGPGYPVETAREFSDKRYEARCRNRACTRKLLMPFMRYCPWCQTKVRRPWKIPGARSKCPRCGWGVLPEFWQCCPWCGRRSIGSR
jgi:serine/threonine-protein kinase